MGRDGPTLRVASAGSASEALKGPCAPKAISKAAGHPVMGAAPPSRSPDRLAGDASTLRYSSDSGPLSAAGWPRPALEYREVLGRSVEWYWRGSWESFEVAGWQGHWTPLGAGLCPRPASSGHRWGVSPMPTLDPTSSSP